VKVRNPRLIRVLAFLGAWLVRLWIGTVRHRYHHRGPDVRPNHLTSDAHFIFAFWHEYLLLPAYHYGTPDILVLISQHADGQLIAEICRYLHFGLIRGSTTRGGVEAVRQMLANGARKHLAITPDGPRGPRREVQPGLVYVASRTGLPIIPIGFAFRRAWRMRSWDHFAVPRPFTLGTAITLEPIFVPADADKDQLERYRRQVEAAMQEATLLAEGWARRGDRQPPASAMSFRQTDEYNDGQERQQVA
jgi:lysophospholipid acyltransferase (LPLAT)-like uncharacterized protein